MIRMSGAERRRMRRIRVSRVVQNNKTVYISKLKGKDLLPRSGSSLNIKIDEWNPISNPNGYQRPASGYRVRAFARYIAEKREISPPPLLLSIRNREARFVPEDGGDEGYIEFPEDSEIYIVDGGHRWKGLVMLEEWIDKGVIERKINTRMTKGELYNMDVPVIFILPYEYEGVENDKDARLIEAYYFTVINETAKKTRSSLSNEFLRRASPMIREKLKGIIGGFKELDRRTVAASVANYLIRNHPVISKFNLKEMGRGRDTFVKSIEQALRREKWFDRLKAELGDDINAITTTVSDYYEDFWDAIAASYPEAFEEDSIKKYIFSTTVGYVPLNRLLSYLLSRFEELGIEFNIDNLKKVFKNMDKFANVDAWRKDGELGKVGTGEKAFKEVEERLKEEINTAIVKIVQEARTQREALDKVRSLALNLKKIGVERDKALDVLKAEFSYALSEAEIEKIVEEVYKSG